MGHELGESQTYETGHTDQGAVTQDVITSVGVGLKHGRGVAMAEASSLRLLLRETHGSGQRQG